MRTICAICNAFQKPRIKQNNDVEIVSERMVNLVNQPNQLKTLVESENGMIRPIVWQRMEAQILTDFPTLTINELRNLTLGVY